MTMLDRVKQCYAAAVEIIGPEPYERTPYQFGGGHNTEFAPSLSYAEGIGAKGAGYDCSAFSSAVLRAGGVLSIPRARLPFDTADFLTWGLEGPGEFLSVIVRNDPETDGVHHMRLDFHGDPAFKNRYCEAPHPGAFCWWVALSPSDLAGYSYRHWPRT